jgi:hypothetical protein
MGTISGAVTLYASMAVAPLGDLDFRLVFLIPALAVDDLEKAITANADVARRIRMKRRLSRWHKNPILALYVCG